MTLSKAIDTALRNNGVQLTASELAMVSKEVEKYVATLIPPSEVEVKVEEKVEQPVQIGLVVPPPPPGGASQ